MMRVGRAFFQALWLTLQGKTLAPAAPIIRYPVLQGWVEEGLQRVRACLALADAADWSSARRNTLMLTLDSRPISMETILMAVEHNLLREYPLLMRTEMEGNITTLYALNLNDRFRVAQLAQTPEVQASPLSISIGKLAEHLDAIPPSNALT